METTSHEQRLKINVQLSAEKYVESSRSNCGTKLANEIHYLELQFLFQQYINALNLLILLNFLQEKVMRLS